MNIKFFISFFCLLWCILTSAFGRETPPPFVVLASGDHVHGQQHIYIPDGYSIEIISLDLKTGIESPGTPGQPQTFSRLEVHKSNSPFEFHLCYTSENPPIVFPKFTGPADIHISDQGGRNSRVVVGLKITELSGSKVIPTNTVVIPSDAAGPVEIMLESSEDLVSWTPVQSGTYGASTRQRFFRVRAEILSK